MDIEKSGDYDLELLKAAHYAIALKDSIERKLLSVHSDISRSELQVLVEEQLKLIESYRDIIIEKCEIKGKRLSIREGYIVALTSITLAPRSIDKRDIESKDAVDVASRIIKKIEGNIEHLM